MYSDYYYSLFKVVGSRCVLVGMLSAICYRNVVVHVNVTALLLYENVLVENINKNEYITIKPIRSSRDSRGLK